MKTRLLILLGVALVVVAVVARKRRILTFSNLVSIVDAAPEPAGPTGPPPKQFAALMTGHDHRAPPNVPVPALHRQFKDPVFGTCITRITDSSQWPGLQRIRHYYSKANPLNADNTRAIMWGNDGTHLLYDAKSWKPIRDVQLKSSDAEVSWHPTKPNIFYHLDHVPNGEVRAMFRYDIAGDGKKLLHDFTEYQAARGKLEGNLDARGRYYAMVGTKSKDNLEAFVYDVENNKVIARMPVTLRMVDDWISVTPTGKYVLMMGKDRSRVFDINLKPVLELPVGSYGHADLCFSADGRDLMVYDGADHQLNHARNINIADLTTGKVSIGTRIGWKSTPHVSCRNLDLPGWALISTQGPDGKYPNHDYEVFWLKLDGSGEVRRVAHHHSDREEGGYFAEQHAVTNRNGTMIFFASNWGRKGVVHDYLVDLRDGACGQPTPKEPPASPSK